MEAASANITNIPGLDTFEVWEWCRFPGGSIMWSGRIHKGKPRNGPQGVPVVMFGHSPRASQVQLMRTLLKHTFCISPNMAVSRTWGGGKAGRAERRGWYKGIAVAGSLT